MIILSEIYLLWPELFLGISITMLLGYGVIYSKKEDGEIGTQNKKITWISIGVLVLTLMLLIQTTETSAIQEITIICSLIILALSLEKESKLEVPLLILLSTLGLLLIVNSRDLIVFYLAFEMIGLSSYILATIKRTGELSTEAGIKYFLLGAVNSGLLLLGSSIIYATTGTLEFTKIAYDIWYTTNTIGVSIGGVLIIITLLFKLAAAPFHMWAPDVYEGSPTIVTAFFATVPKIGLFAILFKLYLTGFIGIASDIQTCLLVSGILSIIIGSIGGINQSKIKRLLAYSAIGHTGYIILGLMTGGLDSIHASMIYIIIYLFMSINIFTIALQIISGIGESNFISELTGLSRSNPILAWTLGLTLFSMAGIPPLAGFFSKYFLLMSLVKNQFIMISIIAVVCSVIGAFYYLRVIKTVYFKESLSFAYKTISSTRIKISLIPSLVIGMTLYFILTFMIYPDYITMFAYTTILSYLG